MHVAYMPRGLASNKDNGSTKFLEKIWKKCYNTFYPQSLSKDTVRKSSTCLG